MNKQKFTPENIEGLKENEIFVFGSNTQGQHHGGAARVAFEKFGAEWGVGRGLTGKSYAIPTLDDNRNKVSRNELLNSFADFIKFASYNKDLTFYLTKVGCGIAGWNIEEVKELFHNAILFMKQDEGIDSPNNLIIPREFAYE